MNGVKTYYFRTNLKSTTALIFFSAAISYGLSGFYESFWGFLGFAFTFFVAGHMALTARRYVILPGLIGLTACLQWVIAACLSYRYPPSFSLYVMSLPEAEYLRYAVPGAIALWAGLHLPLLFRRVSQNESSCESGNGIGKKDRQFMDLLIVAGFLGQFAGGYAPATIGFLFHLIGQLRYVGALSWMIVKAEGWQLRILIVFSYLFFEAASGGIFFEFLLWTGYLFISLAFLRKWRIKILLVLPVVLFLSSHLNTIKSEFRSELQQKNPTRLESVSILGRLMLKTLSGDFVETKEEIIGDKFIRYNQGWIISRTMATVPEIEPFARGETLAKAIVASLVPRILVPDKLRIASKEFFYKYTNLPLSEKTSMALGIAGEMYINFDVAWGTVGIFVYGLAIGWLFSMFAKRALINPLWWAWVPFVLLVTIEAEWNLVDILNFVSKSLLVMLALVYFVPFFKTRLLTKPRTSSAGEIR